MTLVFNLPREKKRVTYSIKSFGIFCTSVLGIFKVLDIFKMQRIFVRV